MQPQPLPGQVFVRPGIDDRPDYEKTLTEEAKAALKRLAVQQNPRVPEASNERPEVQQTLINTESGSPLTAFAHLDAAVPNLESSFLDLRDPMTAPDGTTPTKPQVHRLTAGFALGALPGSAGYCGPGFHRHSPWRPGQRSARGCSCYRRAWSIPGRR